jgi:hypothetical protein
VAYDIQCRGCRRITWGENIVDLLTYHTDTIGRFVCLYCSGNDTFIYRESNLQEEGEVWQRWIKGVICIDSGIETYCPYIFLTADSEDGEPTGLHFHYYKDTRTRPAGRLKHGHGPGGPPVLGNRDLFFIIEHLLSIKALSREEVKEFAARL